jgi:hypothetical protein
MRFGSVSALVLTGFALAACAGDSGDTTCGNLSITNPCVAAATSTSGAAATLTPIVPVPTGTGTSTNVGNTTTLGTGDTTIALEFANLISPAAGSQSTLTEVAGTPNTAKLAIDTKATSNGDWPIPKTMDEYVAGTNSTGGIGLGGTYKEYRKISPGGADEELQVWHWGNSYGTQYRDVTGSGGEARHQAWSFGGTATATANMPTGGTASYNGQYGATSKTYNFVDDSNPLRKLSANGSWQVEGTSQITANFGTAQMTGTLTPQTWRGTETLNGGTARRTVLSSNTADPNFSGFMNDNVVLKGSISGNTVSGTAEMDPSQGWINGVNPMYAGFFGATGPKEVTGVYNFVAVNPDPIGGQPPINDDTRGYVQQSGIFNGSCTPGVGACPP